MAVIWIMEKSKQKKQQKQEYRARKLSVRTNESSLFARLSPSLMVAPMLRRLHRIIKAVQTGNGKNPSVFLCVCLSQRVSWTPPRETSSCVCHSNPFFFSSVRVTECDAHESKQAFKSLSCICLCAYKHTLHGGKKVPGAEYVVHVLCHTYNHKLREG